jgi:hypothetical protein
MFGLYAMGRLLIDAADVLIVVRNKAQLFPLSLTMSLRHTVPCFALPFGLRISSTRIWRFHLAGSIPIGFTYFSTSRCYP